MNDALAPGGHAIIATFDSEGPEQCSGLDVCRYDEATMRAEMPDWLELVRTEGEMHKTPWGAEQAFRWIVMRRMGGSPIEVGRAKPDCGGLTI